MADKLRAHLGSYWYLWQMSNQQTASRLTTPFSNSLHDSAMQIIAGQTSRSGVGDRTLVITTAHGIQRWTKLVSSGSAAQAVECSVFKRKLADACDAKRQLMLVHFSDAVLAVARSGGSFWSMVVLDRTSIRSECGSVDLSPLFQVLDLGTAVFIYVL
ncbi:hypothetical protein FBU59_005942 [Linderina macrospora]|uniref:Uncharacterized protein n=1 Tax=Linderina macrospora TaxID=4868 RepID=A0ACC1J1C4_9FUNG|nr:hypothetical protein FBU59_005942 [Linderina macrospora]